MYSCDYKAERLTVLSHRGIFVAIAENTLYGSKLYFFKCIHFLKKKILLDPTFFYGFWQQLGLNMLFNEEDLNYNRTYEWLIEVLNWLINQCTMYVITSMYFFKQLFVCIAHDLQCLKATTEENEWSVLRSRIVPWLFHQPLQPVAH